MGGGTTETGLPRPARTRELKCPPQRGRLRIRAPPSKSRASMFKHRVPACFQWTSKPCLSFLPGTAPSRQDPREPCSDPFAISRTTLDNERTSRPPREVVQTQEVLWVPGRRRRRGALPAEVHGASSLAGGDPSKGKPPGFPNAISACFPKTRCYPVSHLDASSDPFPTGPSPCHSIPGGPASPVASV